MRQSGRPPAAAGKQRAPVDSLVAEAWARMQQGDSAGAEQLCRESLQRSPRHPHALHLLGLLAHREGRAEEALAALRRAAKAAPRDSVLLNNLGNVLREQGQLDEAVKAYRRVLAERPDYASARFNLGKALQASGETAAAVACLQALVERAPQDAAAWDALGAALLDAGRAEEAEAAHRRAIALDPQLADAHNGLGLVLMDVGRFDEAAECYRRALELDPGLTKAGLNLSKVRRYKSDDRADLALLESMAATPGLGDDERADLHFALGKVHDDLGDHERAFREYARGNELCARSDLFDIDAYRAWVDTMIEVVTPALLERCEGFGRDDRTPVFIVGMPRSGTTLTEQILASHRQVFGADELYTLQLQVNRLPGVLGGKPYPHCMARMHRRAAQRLADAYLADIRTRGGDAARVTDKMPGNFVHIGLIALALPGATLVNCRRDPMDVGLSIFFHRFAAGHAYGWRLEHIAEYYLQYLRLMEHWRALLPGRILDLHYEQLVADPESVSRTLLAHCGLDWDERCLEPHRTRRSVHTASGWQVRQPIHRNATRRWLRYAPFLGELRDALRAGGVAVDDTPG